MCSHNGLNYPSCIVMVKNKWKTLAVNLFLKLRESLRNVAVLCCIQKVNGTGPYLESSNQNYEFGKMETDTVNL